MKAVILAGGFGTRLSEETHLKPKPLVEIYERPILWHIMKIYSNFGINDFIICLGYKGYLIKEYFYNYSVHSSDVTIDLRNNQIELHSNNIEPWKVSLIDTGYNTMTGGRLKRVSKHIEEDFCFTYGDGVSDVNISELIKFHKKNGKIATVTAAAPPGRFGVMGIEENTVKSFNEKPKNDSSYINAGFFVLSPEIFNYIDSDETVFEKAPLENLAKENELIAFKHDGFWQCMDTLRDKNYLTDLLKNNRAPWKTWQNK